jgi:hypothetical protein
LLTLTSQWSSTQAQQLIPSDLPTHSNEAKKAHDSASATLFEDALRFTTTACHSFVYQGIQSPVTGAAQLIDHTCGTDTEKRTQWFNKPEQAAFGSLDWHAEQVGNGLGMAADFLVVNKLLNLGASKLPTAAAEILGASKVGLIGKSALTGAIYQGVLTPVVGEGADFRNARLENAFTGGVTFAAMAGAGVGFRAAVGTAGPESGIAARLLKSNLAMGTVAGLTSGAVNSETTALLSHKWHPSAKDATQSAYSFLVAGAPLGFVHALSVPDVGKMAVPSEFSDRSGTETSTAIAKQDIPAAISLASDQATAPSAPGKQVDLAGEQIAKSPDIEPLSEKIETQRPLLTPANNPIGLFEREVSGYWEEVTRREGSIDTQDPKQLLQAGKELRTLKTNFAGRLLELWHGTEAQPGIANHTDAELATPSMTAEKIAQLRQEFIRGRHDYVMAEMMGISDPHWSVTQKYGVDQNLILPAKESFFDYQGLYKKTDLPRYLEDLASRGGGSRDAGFPVNYFPYEPTPTLPNLFHGTSSVILDSIIREKAVLSADEVRARGIEKTTGEGGSGCTPGVVSTLKYFSGGAYWANHSSNQTIAGYPLVLGISRDVISRGSYGYQSGEVVFPKELKLDGKEVTHLFVPDREVGDVSGRLAVGNITGVQVVGFGSVKPPTFPPQP